MKILFSINQKVFDNSPQDIIWILKKYDVNHTVAGFEICFDIHNENHIHYVEEMAVLCKKNNYILTHNAFFFIGRALTICGIICASACP